MELSVTLQLCHDEFLHRLEVLLVEHLSDQIEDQEGLLVRNRTELECAHHVEHCLNHLLPQGVV